jgi:predicted transcriptional regulator
MDNMISHRNATDHDALSLFDMTTDIARRYARARDIQPEEMPRVFLKVYGFLHTLFQGDLIKEACPILQPAARIEDSVRPDSLTCLEDGLHFKALKKHLRTSHGMTPEQYKEKWGLEADYPMVASLYSQERQAIAKTIGLGKKKKK